MKVRGFPSSTGNTIAMKWFRNGLKSVKVSGNTAVVGITASNAGDRSARMCTEHPSRSITLNTELQRESTLAVEVMELKSTTPRRLPLRNSSVPMNCRMKFKALDSALSRQSRRVSRLDNALEDARVHSEYPAFITPRRTQRHIQREEVKEEDVSVDQLQSVYDRVEHRIKGSTQMSNQSPSLSATQTQSAELAVQAFVAKMRHIANIEDGQEKANMIQTLSNDVVSRGVSSSLWVMQQQNHEVDAQQPDDITCWYQVGNEIGRGTFGRVRLGTHRLSGTPVAIKSYARLHGARSCLAVDAIGKRTINDSRGDALEWRRVRQEMDVLSKLRPHPNIMYFLEVFETPTRIHAIIEFVRGTSLCDVLRRAPGQRIKESRAKQIFRQLAAAVRALHAQRVIHRDLKLENILLDERSGHATVIDFGFSDFEETNEPQMLNPAEENDPKKLWKKKNFCGTPSYMAPEVVASECYDGRPVDVWSLGVLLFVMLCGKFPFQGTSFHQLYQKLRSGAQQLVLPVALSAGARAVLQAALTVDPAKRPSAEDLCYHAWLRDHENPHTSLALQISVAAAFEAWTGTKQAVCTALEELYGVPLNPLVFEEPINNTGPRRRCHLDAFVKLAKLMSSRHFQKIVDTSSAAPPSKTTEGRQLQQNNEDSIAGKDGNVQDIQESEEIVTSSLRHKQQLEKLIGLVKTSLDTI